MTVIEPCDAVETRKAILAAVDYKGPVYIRLGRAAVPVITKKEDPYTIGKANILRMGDDVAIVACGALVVNSLTAADMLLMEGIKATVVNMHTVKPIDQELLVKVAKQVNALVTAEQHVLDGGLGSAVASIVARTYPVPIEMVGIDNRFGQSGEPDILFKEYHLLPEDIVFAAKQAIRRKKK
jgi:transketolase